MEGPPALLFAVRLGDGGREAEGGGAAGLGGFRMEAEHQRELCQVLADHAKRYPLMAPCDVVKLIFQNEFGG